MQEEKYVFLIFSWTVPLSLTIYHSTTKLVLSMYHILSIFMVQLSSFSLKSQSQGQRTMLKAFLHLYFRLQILIIQIKIHFSIGCADWVRRETVHGWYKILLVNIQNDEPPTQNVFRPPSTSPDRMSAQLDLSCRARHLHWSISQPREMTQFFPSDACMTRSKLGLV